VALTAREYRELRRLSRRRAAPYAEMVRAKILLLAYEHPEWSNAALAHAVGCTDRTVLTPNDFSSTHQVRRSILSFFAERNRRTRNEFRIRCTKRAAPAPASSNGGSREPPCPSLRGYRASFSYRLCRATGRCRFR
jgi:hypothetical protein